MSNYILYGAMAIIAGVGLYSSYWFIDHLKWASYALKEQHECDDYEKTGWIPGTLKHGVAVVICAILLAALMGLVK